MLSIPTIPSISVCRPAGILGLSNGAKGKGQRGNNSERWTKY